MTDLSEFYNLVAALRREKRDLDMDGQTLYRVDKQRVLFTKGATIKTFTLDELKKRKEKRALLELEECCVEKDAITQIELCQQKAGISTPSLQRQPVTPINEIPAFIRRVG